jgi:hypothetical protein
MNPLRQHRLTLLQFRWEVSLIAVISVVIATLALVTGLFGYPDYSIRANTSKAPTPTKLDSPADSLRQPQTKAVPSQSPRATAKSPRRLSQPPDPHQVTVGPNTISGRFILLGSERTHINPTSDELTLRLRVVSLAAANLVTPYQSWMLKVQAPGRAPIEPKESFSHPVAAGDAREDEITFAIPPDLSLRHSTLNINYYNETKAIPLDLRTRTSQRSP